MYQHTFAICAYGQSPYIAACIESVLSQRNVTSEVYIATSTPSEWLNAVARMYELPVYVNDGEGGIGPDWNFAYAQATGTYVTIAHQDDLYCADYASDAVARLSGEDDALLYFCNYGEVRNDDYVNKNRNLAIKRFLLAPLVPRRGARSRWAKRLPIAMGNGICCPSACFNKAALPDPPFDVSLKNALDWDCWERLSRQEGAFCYSPRILMYHRIHEDSATSEYIQNNTRAQEDLQMLGRFWPEPIARAICKVYARGMDSNAL